MDTRKFPDMRGLVTYGHSLGLKVGGYMNNCICMEGGDPPMGTHCVGVPRYEQDVAFLVNAQFDGVKIDNCGPAHNVTRWAELFNASGRPMRIESCHTFHPNHGTPSGWPNFPVWDPATSGGNQTCPMNLYRTGGDISPSFGSILGEAYATVQYTDRPDPFSHPGCWAYPDMQEIGNFRGAEPMRSDEERTHWGLWCIISAPLVLGTDLNDTDTLDRIWSIITNTEALAVNEAWAGMPGTLVRSYAAVGGNGTAVASVVDQAPCDGRAGTLGWRIMDGRLGAALGMRSAGDAVCLSTQSNCGYVPPPPTTRSPHSGCGALFVDCASHAAEAGNWSLNGTTGLLRWQPRTQPAQPKCLSAKATSPVGGFYGGPQAAVTALGGCPGNPLQPPNSSTFRLSARGELIVGTGACLLARHVYGPQLWAKPLPGGRVAALVINLVEQAQDFSLPLADVPDLACAERDRGSGSCSCAVRDVWAMAQLAAVPCGGAIDMTLRGHQSMFFILG